MLQQWERQFPGRVENIFAALQNVAPSHLADAALFDFAGLGSRNPVQTMDWLMSSPLAQGMAGGLVLVVLLVLLKFVTKVVKVIIQLLVLVTLVLLLVAGYFGWKNRKTVVDGARDAAERIKVRAADGWKLVEPFVQREERE